MSAKQVFSVTEAWLKVNLWPFKEALALKQAETSMPSDLDKLYWSIQEP